MRNAAILMACALPLAACNSSPQVDAKNATTAEVAKKVRDAGGEQSLINPGLWQSKVTIEKFDVPGMPAEMVERMKAMMAERQPHDFQTCLTAEDVRRPKEDFFAGSRDECRYDHFTMGGGKIDAVMRCGKGGERQLMQMAGTYSPDSYQMQTSMKMEGGSEPAAGMAMTMRVEAQRVGNCTAKG